MSSFFEMMAMILSVAFVCALVGYLFVGLAVGITWPFWMFT
jgi:hypothetical protein